MTPIALVTIGSIVAACSPTPVPSPRVQSPCLVVPGGDSVASNSPAHPIRILVADSASQARFVRQPVGSVVDCEGMPRPELVSPVDPPATIDSLPAGADPRDALDRNSADLIVTRDPATLAYARSRPDLIVVPLPWDLVYVLTIRAPSDSSWPSGPEWTSLATEAVRGDVRAPAPPFWWRDDPGCGATTLRPGDQVGYGRRDPIARDLAERIVALTAMARPPRWLAAEPKSWRAVPVSSTDRALAALVSTHSRTAEPPAGCGAGRNALPLLESRPSVIVRRGIQPFLITRDGTVVFLPRSRR